MRDLSVRNLSKNAASSRRTLACSFLYASRSSLVPIALSLSLPKKPRFSFPFLEESGDIGRSSGVMPALSCPLKEWRRAGPVWPESFETCCLARLLTFSLTSGCSRRYCSSSYGCVQIARGGSALVSTLRWNISDRSSNEMGEICNRPKRDDSSLGQTLEPSRRAEGVVLYS